MGSPPCYVYYCSGHGYGHATRVSAFASHLLSLPDSTRPIIHIVSSAPKHVFGDSIERGALYRFADWIDPVVVQPLAYCVDRQKSVEVLRAFLNKKDAFLETERQWLVDIGARCVLSDAAFLGCLAAKAAGVPSILITNFTFDSVYSYLSTTLIDEPQQPKELDASAHHHHHHNNRSLAPDIPIPTSVITPLVEQIHAGYRCADLLVLLPGQIPIPSFSKYPALPSPTWVDTKLNRFFPQVVDFLNQDPSSYTLHPHIPFPSNTLLSRQSFTRKILPIPLLVRPPLSSLSVYTPKGRARLLSSIGIPSHQHNPNETRILVVSFGGQVFRRPGSRSSSRSTSRAASRGTTPEPSEVVATQASDTIKPTIHARRAKKYPVSLGITEPEHNPKSRSFTTLPQVDIPPPPPLPFGMRTTSLSPATTQGTAGDSQAGEAEVADHRLIDPHPMFSPRLATESHIWIPGAPPAMKRMNSSTSSVGSGEPGTGVGREGFMNMKGVPILAMIPPTPTKGGGGGDEDEGWIESVGITVEPPTNGDVYDPIEDELDAPRLLPDTSWIAIVCGVSKEQWGESEDELPEGFYVAPRDVYMPDLTAVGDVLLGKLGYGTVSECVDSCTPFVYVARPLFIEEHGLRLLLDRDGVGVELSRQSYEAGDWAAKVEEAWEKGRGGKVRKREEESEGGGLVGVGRREEEGRKVAEEVVEWVEECWRGM